MQWGPAVDHDSAGNFVVVWDSRGGFGNDTSGNSIQGQIFDSAGTAVGSQFQVNTYTYDYQFSTQVAVSPGGNFVVVWSSFYADGDTTQSVQQQIYFGPLQ